jgi:Ca2+-binding RTX toxin-like protein
VSQNLDNSNNLYADSLGAGDGTIDGLGGDDTLSGLGGADSLFGGDGADSLSGGDGNDSFAGSPGADTFLGGSGIDLADYSANATGLSYDVNGLRDGLVRDQLLSIEVVLGGSGRDVLQFNSTPADGATVAVSLFGAAGDDILIGNVFADSLDGGDGGDVLRGFSSSDTLSGGAGNDTLLGDESGDIYGSDSLNGGDGNDVINGDAGSIAFGVADTLLGEAGNDTLGGKGGDDVLVGGGDDDNLAGGRGGDSLVGGDGNDIADFSENFSVEAINVAVGGGFDGTGSFDTFVGIEGVIGTSGNDLVDFLAAPSAALLDGRAGADTLTGSALGDTLIGGAGGDSLLGGDGLDIADYSANAAGEPINVNTGGGSDGTGSFDTFVGIEGVIGGGGNDLIGFFAASAAATIDGRGGDDLLAGGTGNDLVLGGEGIDLLRGNAGDDTLEGGAGEDQLIADSTGGAAGQNSLSGGDGNDQLFGGSLADTIDGDNDDDLIDAGGGDDLVRGGAGSDNIFAGLGFSVVEGGTGNDSISFADSQSGGDGNDVLLGAADAETLRGDADADSLVGNENDDLLEGSTGADTLAGNAGNDVLDGGDGDDIADYAAEFSDITADPTGASGFDAGADSFNSIEGVIGGFGNDTLDFSTAGAAATLVGGDGDDRLAGGSGDDLLQGKVGANTLDGGGGNDRVVLDDGIGQQADGGAGSADVLAFAGAPRTVTITDNGNGTFTVTNPTEIAATVQGFEFLDLGAGAQTNFGAGTFPIAVCFAAGTDILTARGEVRVEDLRAGDVVATLSGRGAPMQPVLWVGRRHVALAGKPNAEPLSPIRIRAGALGGGVPTRDLLVSPDHCLFLDGALVPARLLVDGEAIVVERGLAEVTYFHVEVERHDVLVANGAAAESWLDAGNRAWFANAPVALLRVGGAPDAYAAAAAEPCAPILQGGPRLAAIRDGIALRAAATAPPAPRRAAG